MAERKSILVDLDGVVYDWVHTMAWWLKNNGALTKPVQELIESYSTWEIWDDWGIPEGEFMRWWRLGIEEGVIYKKGYDIDGARRALWQLSDAEWDIHIATSRLTKFGLHDSIVENTAYWLRENNIPYRSLSFTDRKSEILADAIVDDNLINFGGAGHGVQFLFGAPHNRSTLTWDTIIEELL